MKQPTLTASGKPFDLHERLLLFACDAKEARFRLRVCRLTDHLDAKFDPLVQESDEIVRILATIVHRASRRRAADDASAS